MDVATLVAAEHGVVSARRLAGSGVSRVELQRLVRGGALRRIRAGWFASANAHPTVLSAVRAGGVLGCVSALRFHGVWVPELTRVHVRARPAATRSNPSFCRQYGRPAPEIRSVDDLPIALRHAVKCLNKEGIVVVCDSLIHTGMLDRHDIATELARAPARIRHLLDRCDQAESGIETMVRVRLRARGIRVAAQVELPGIGRVDLLVGDLLILEIDGRQFHIGARFEIDRERDQQAARLGYTVIRISYHQVMHRWEAVEEAILAVVRRGGHLA